MFSKLLIRPKPFMNESLASYMNRICCENVCKIDWIVEPYRVYKKTMYINLNRPKNDKITSKIIQATGLSQSELKNMTFDRFIVENCISELAVLFIWKRIKCCPLCLKEKYYQQIHWQLDYVKICLKHNTVLLNLCTCGKPIEINELIKGTCRCGMKLNKLKPLYNKDEKIYINQYRFYKAFGIEQKNKKNSLEEEIFCGLKKEKFLALYYMLATIMKWAGKIKPLELSKVYCLGLNKIDEINKLLIIEKILNDYPSNFYILLDFLNSKQKPASDIDKMRNHIKVGTPISCIISFMHKKWHELFYKELHYYLVSRYDKFNNEVLSLNEYAKENKYISENILIGGYLFPSDSIESLFKIKKDGGVTYVEIDEVLNFIRPLISRGTVLFDKDREDFIVLKELFNSFSIQGCGLGMITNIIFENKICIKICLNEDGLDMIYVHKNSAIKSIVRVISEINKKQNFLN